MISDEELMLQLRMGSEAALEALVGRYHQRMHSFIYRMTCDHHLAEDLSQETFIRLCTSHHRYQYPKPFRTWLFTIAANLVRDWAKSAYKRRVSTSNDESWLQPHERNTEETPLSILEKQEERRAVVDALMGLSTAHREAIVLRYYHGLKLSEIAEVAGVPEGTVKSRLAYASAYLRQKFGEMIDKEGDKVGSAR